MQQVKQGSFARLFMLAVILLPVLAQYHLGNALDLDIIAMLAVLLFSLLFGFRLHLPGLVLVLMGYVALVTLLNLAGGARFSSTSDIILRSGRYLVYLFIVFCLGRDGLFDYKTAMKLYRFVAYAATAYIILQAIFFYGVGITLPNRIGGATTDVTEEVGRLRAFYSEPADMAYSIIPFAVCRLFGDNSTLRGNPIVDALAVTVAVILSTSGQGILCLGLMWAVFLCLMVKRGRVRLGTAAITILGMALVFGLYEVGILEFALGRIDTSGETGAVSARASGYVTLSLLSPLQWLFGTGYGNYVTENVFGLDIPYEYVNYSSLAECIFTTGIIGLFLMSVLLVRLSRADGLRSRMMVLAMLFLSLGGCPLTGKYLPLYFLLTMAKEPIAQNGAEAP